MAVNSGGIINPAIAIAYIKYQFIIKYINKNKTHLLPKIKE